MDSSRNRSVSVGVGGGVVVADRAPHPVTPPHTTGSPGADPLAAMRATLARYREMVDASDAEKLALQGAVRSLAAEADAARRDATDARIERDAAVLAAQAAERAAAVAHATSTATASATIVAMPGSGSARGPSPSRALNTSAATPAASLTSSRASDAAAAASGARSDAGSAVDAPATLAAGRDTAADAGRGTSLTQTERLARDVRMLQAKNEHMARELERVHAEHQTELRRLRLQSSVSAARADVGGAAGPSAAATDAAGARPPWRDAHVERLTGALAIANNKSEQLVRETQRLHSEYQAEIRRLHRLVAKLEGQLVDLAEYSYLASSASSASPQPQPRPAPVSVPALALSPSQPPPTAAAAPPH